MRLRARRTTTARPQVVLKKRGGPALALELGRVPVVVRGHDLLSDHDGLSVLPQDVDRVNLGGFGEPKAVLGPPVVAFRGVGEQPEVSLQL